MNPLRRVLQIFSLLLALACSAIANAVTVVEYYNSALDAYFIIGRTNEQALLDGSRGFGRTGMSFPATDATVGSATLSRICRFYVSTSNPFTSSHYYGKEGSDCEGIRAQNVPGFFVRGLRFCDRETACEQRQNVKPPLLPEPGALRSGSG